MVADLWVEPVDLWVELDWINPSKPVFFYFLKIFFNVVGLQPGNIQNLRALVMEWMRRFVIWLN